MLFSYYKKKNDEKVGATVRKDSETLSISLFSIVNAQMSHRVVK